MNLILRARFLQSREFVQRRYNVFPLLLFVKLKLLPMLVMLGDKHTGLYSFSFSSKEELLCGSSSACPWVQVYCRCSADCKMPLSK